VIELGFPLDLYSQSAVTDALRAYESVADHALEMRDGRCVVRLTAKGDMDEQLLADELANYVLGLSIERRGR
jgi:hypothetical protein